MSQFGTIGAPRMHPCVSHPSCSQFNAKDIILTSDGIPRPRPNKPSNFNHFEEFQKGIQNDLRHGMTSFDIEQKLKMETLLNNKQRLNEYIDGDDGNRKYVEVSPGVWSYTG